MGWNSAVQTAYSFFKADESLEYVMLLNTEFPMDKKGTVLPNNFTISDATELDWKAPFFTLGEADSACIFQKDNSIAVHFEFIESPEYAQMCSIPVINFEKYFRNTDTISQSQMKFYANGAGLLDVDMQRSCDVLKRFLNKLDYMPKVISPHSASEKTIMRNFLHEFYFSLRNFFIILHFLINKPQWQEF